MMLDLISATLLSVGVATALVVGTLWIRRACRRWRKRRARTIPEATVYALTGLGRRLILLAEFLDSAIICWRDTMRQRRPIRTRSEVDRELRRLGHTMEVWRT